jgi:uncharacterized membrane protein
VSIKAGLLSKVKLNRSAYIIASLCLLFLSLVFAVPQPVLAQSGKIGLDIYVTTGFNHTMTPGKSSSIFISVRNSGTVDLTNIEFSAKNPAGWAINFSPPRLDSLSPGSSQAIEVSIIPDKKIASGDYYITLVAQSSEVRQVVEIFAPVEAPSLSWFLIGGIIAAVAVAAFVFVFLHFNKR